MSHNHENPYVFESERPVVETNKGKLRGLTYGDVNIFMGVPYAHAKRFHMPEEVEPWEGIKNAYQHGPVPMLINEATPFNYHRGFHVLQTHSEDCQNLNIWAPKCKPGEKKAVFVFMHGGGFFGGNAYEEVSFDGFNMAHFGDVIFVSINHRLNVVGYLNLEDFGEEFKNSANAGLFDLVVALKWIHENIAAFGGDPENVTICGHSGGGGKVQCMLQIEEAAPYFQRAICLSGARAPGNAAPGGADRESTREAGRAVMAELGITKENIDKLYEISYEEIAAACVKASNARMYAPVENEYFPGFPAVTKLMPWSAKKPVIYGSVLGEFPICRLTAEEKAAMTEEDKVAYFKKTLGERAEEAIALFREAYPDHDIIDLAYLDTRCRTAVVKSAEAHLAAGCENVYVFLGAYSAPENGRIPIWHGGEVAYIFMNEDRVLVLNGEEGKKYAKIFSNLVLNFVKTGDPNNEYLPKWEKYTTDCTNTMIIDTECRLVADHDTKLMELVSEIGPKFTLGAMKPPKK